MSSGENPRKKYPKLCSESAGEPIFKRTVHPDQGQRQACRGGLLEHQPERLRCVRNVLG